MEVIDFIRSNPGSLPSEIGRKTAPEGIADTARWARRRLAALQKAGSAEVKDGAWYAVTETVEPATKSRQVRRAEARRAGKPEPDVIGQPPAKPRTSYRHIGKRTKGLPYSRHTLEDTIMIPEPGTPAALVLKHPTKGTRKVKRATPELLDVFYPSLPPNLAAPMLGLV